MDFNKKSEHKREIFLAEKVSIGKILLLRPDEKAKLHKTYPSCSGVYSLSPDIIFSGTQPRKASGQTSAHFKHYHPLRKWKGSGKRLPSDVQRKNPRCGAFRKPGKNPESGSRCGNPESVGAAFVSRIYPAQYHIGTQ
jgi:hypothetical protein